MDLLYRLRKRGGRGQKREDYIGGEGVGEGGGNSNALFVSREKKVAVRGRDHKWRWERERERLPLTSPTPSIPPFRRRRRQHFRNSGQIVSRDGGRGKTG